MPEEEKDTYPYCGGCGHNYYNLPKMTAEEAKKGSENTRCQWCIEEAAQKGKQDQTAR